MADLSAWFGSAAPVLVVILLAFVFLWTVLLTRRMHELRARLDGLTRGEKGGSLEAVLEAHLRKVGETASGLQVVERRTSALEARLPSAVQQVGLVRYNPFEDTGSNQSFALALLDGSGDGVVVSSLHSRQATRIYVKPVANGAADRGMSEEEAEAIRQAVTPPRPPAKA